MRVSPLNPQKKHKDLMEVLQVSCKRIKFSSWFRAAGIMKPSREQRFCFSLLFTVVQLGKAAVGSVQGATWLFPGMCRLSRGFFPLTRLQFETQTSFVKMEVLRSAASLRLTCC